MSRVVFERSLCDGFRTTKVEQIVCSAYGKKLFVGTTDGLLAAYECRQESSAIGRLYSCKILETLRKQSKDKKQMSSITHVESWRVFLCICDGHLMAYDSEFFQHLTTLVESKGCHLFAVNERQSSIALVIKKKLYLYFWQQSTFILRKEFSLQDVPKTIYFHQCGIIIGYRRFYESIDPATGLVTRILDFEKEHKMACFEIPSSPVRSENMVLSIGLQGVLIPSETIQTARAFSYNSLDQERIEWSSPPWATQLLNPFILSVLSDSNIEVHDLASLNVLQRISISSAAPQNLSLSVCCNDSNKCGPQPNFSQHAFVCNGEQLSVLKMIPLTAQVELLVSNGQFEQAINMCKVCSNSELLAGIDLIFLYESAAKAYFAQANFEKSLLNYSLAKSDFVDVARHFPDLIPLPLHLSFNVHQTKKLSGSILHRAALAMVSFCEHHRVKIVKRAALAEKARETGILGAGTRAFSNWKQSTEYGEEEEEEYIVDPEDDLRRAQLLDSILLFSLMNCSPIRKESVIGLVSKQNRCHIESCSVLLASHGNAYTEALLWLYRSQNQHSRVLQALTEDKCVAIGAWTTEQFYNWTADYLRWLWYNDDDVTLPRQALVALKPLLEYDAELGLSVLVCRPPNKDTFGGKGVTINEVLAFLRSTSPKINYNRTNLSYGSSFNLNNSALTKLKERGSLWTNEKGVAEVIATTPLLNGHALGVAFLECLISSGEAPPNMHDEFAQLLIEGLPETASSLTDFEIRSDDDEVTLLHKIYRRKLQLFLANSEEYHANRILKVLPQDYSYELGLVVSRLGKHKEVLKIYLHSLHDMHLAELYCESLFTSMHGIGKAEKRLNRSANLILPSFKSVVGLQNAGDIYLLLFEVMLTIEDTNVEQVIKLAETYFERFDPTLFLQLLPPSTSVSLLSRYFKMVLEAQTSQKRSLQVAHQLLRKREVLLRTQSFK